MVERAVVAGGARRGRPAGRPHRRPRASSTTHPFWRLAIACGHQRLMQHANLPSNSKYNVCMQLMCVLCASCTKIHRGEREDQKCHVEMTEHGSSLVVRTPRPAGRPEDPDPALLQMLGLSTAQSVGLWGPTTMHASLSLSLSLFFSHVLKHLVSNY